MSCYVNKNCPVCDGYVRLITNNIEVCENCGYTLPQPTSVTINDYGPYATETLRWNSSYQEGVGIDSAKLNTIIIGGCDEIRLTTNGVEFNVDIGKDKLKDIEEIIINGYKFVKDNGERKSGADNDY